MAGPSSTHTGWHRDKAANSYLSVYYEGTEVARYGTTNQSIVNGRRFIIGDPDPEVVSSGDGSTNMTPGFQVLGTGQDDGSMLLAVFSETATRAAAPTLALAKGGNASIGSHTVVTSGEILGSIIAYGDDGTDLESPAAAIEFAVDGTPGTGDMPGRIVFYTTADGGETLAEFGRIANDQNLYVANDNGIVIGNTAQITAEFGPAELQVLGTGSADSMITIARFVATAAAGFFSFVKSRDGTIGSNTIVQDDDDLGSITWNPDDGVDFQTGAALFKAEVDDASPAAGDIGAAFVWEAMSGGGTSATEKMRLDAAGVLRLTNAVTAPGSAGSGTNQVGLFSEDVSSSTVLGIECETAVAAETDETKFSNKIQVRINGSSYFIMLTTT